MSNFPISLDDPIVHGGVLPKSVDVVVIGAGIIGVMTSWFLARKGISVLLLEKGRIAGEQSSRNWGWIRVQGRDPDEIPIVKEAREIWKGLEADTGEDLGFRQVGITYLAKDQADMARYENWLVHAKANDLDSRLLQSNDLAELLPNSGISWAGALHTASDCRAEPWKAVPAIAMAASRAGVLIRENCAVRNLDITAGQIAGVHTELGHVICNHVVLAAGAWSSLFTRAHGVGLPQLSVRATVAATQPMLKGFEGAAVDDRLAFRRRQDGGFSLAPSGFHELFIGPDAFRNLRRFLPQLKQDPFGTHYFPFAPKNYPDAWGTSRNWLPDQVSPFEKMRVLNPKSNINRVQKLARDFAATFPSLGPVEIRNSWAGMIDTMPDVVPVIDHVEKIPGFTIATGMSGHGFGIGPAVGRILADMVTGNPPGHDLTRFRLSRFTDGTALDLGPSL